MTDLVIIGGGPAGLTAAVYAARAGKSVTVCEMQSLGGQITQAHLVNNYPAIENISGMELGDKLCSHAMNCGAEIQFTQVLQVEKTPEGFSVTTEDEVIPCRSVIYAGGARPTPLSLPREAELTGSGISYCALCDGAFFKDQEVAVVGGGNSAFDDALFLAGVCKTVTLIHRRHQFRAENALVEAAKKTPNIRFLTGATVQSLNGADKLESVTVDTEDGVQEISVSGLFVALGRSPECSLISHLADLDERGYCDSDENCATRTPGLYVAGDCRKKLIRQLTTATADGTVAATHACAWLDK
ncbi:MAG: FAD-dependent oxidoreductase [Ruminococcaceae bacterium]|nr:FAD-dependent oxidoreductase [Oscillospiraceae bacterium]